MTKYEAYAEEAVRTAVCDALHLGISVQEIHDWIAAEIAQITAEQAADKAALETLDDDSVSKN